MNTQDKKTYCRLLTIAGSDSGGGAGIQADLKTFSALGCYGMSVITALTAQNTLAVTGIHAVPSLFVEQQLEAVLSDIGTDAVKIGMLYSEELIDVVSAQLKRYAVDKVVLDPVMVAKSGDTLLRNDAIDAMKKFLFPLSTVITPNLPEAEILTGQDITGVPDMKEAARMLAQYGSQSVLIKGGHLKGNGESTDLLYLSKESCFILFTQPRIETENTHGTGCTLSSAIAAFLAKGDPIAAAVEKAKAFVTEAIRAGQKYKLGKGHGPLFHFFNSWD